MSVGDAMAAAMEKADRRRRVVDILLFAALAAILGAVFFGLGHTFGLRLLAEIACYALLALGLTMQWGYAGLFNAGVLGFVALGGFGLVFMSSPVEPQFWSSDALPQLLLALGLAVGSILAVWALRRYARGMPTRLRLAVQAAILVVGTLLAVRVLGPAADEIEAMDAGFMGGLGLPPLLGWALGGALAAGAAYAIGKAVLGLRSDYLAIATLGAAEIVRSILKNEDWLTRGTLTVSPLPWPTPEAEPGGLGIEIARAGYAALGAVLIAIVYLLMSRAYYAPWGRMIRAIRDDEDAAAAMGKDVDGRRLQIFVIGSALIGVGGAALTGFNGIFDPAAYSPLNNTFLIWVMVIVGGAGNNVGAVFGAALVYTIWLMSDPVMQFIFRQIAEYGQAWFGWQAPSDFVDARAAQMKVFLIGLVIALALRFAPRGLFPERPPRVD